MAVPEYRALVVNQEPALRVLTIRELSDNGFVCDAACDGLQARQLTAARHYDVVVMDLCMPEMNGQSLAVELLGRKNRPALVILTEVTEPTLAKDLIARGVDDFIFRPIDHGVLASRLRALLDRRTSQPMSESRAIPTPASN
jgi:two-component system OmpR family response regulator